MNEGAHGDSVVQRSWGLLIKPQWRSRREIEPLANILYYIFLIGFRFMNKSYSPSECRVALVHSKGGFCLLMTHVLFRKESTFDNNQKNSTATHHLDISLHIYVLTFSFPIQVCFWFVMWLSH